MAQLVVMIRINIGPIFFPEWHCRGITKVRHLRQDDSNKFLTLLELQTSNGLKICPFKYCRLLTVLKALWNKHKGNFATDDSEYLSFLERVSKAQKASQIVYAKLAYLRKSILPTHTQQKWIEECNIEGNKYIKWYESYQLAPKCTKSTRVVEFQFKLLHRRTSAPNLWGTN